jgi:hypothetical protein
VTCAKCFHEKNNHEGVVCSGALDCMCQEYVAPVLVEFAQEIEMQKERLKTIYDKCLYLLKKIPQSRNAGEKTFYKIFIEVWYGQKIRKEGSTLTTAEWKRLPNQDTVNREKRRVKQIHPEYATYDPKLISHQTALWQAFMERAIEA